jgi:hypothetical protein
VTAPQLNRRALDGRAQRPYQEQYPLTHGHVMNKYATRSEMIKHYIAIGRPDIAERMRENDRRRSREFRDRYPHLIRATQAVREALQRGDLMRPSTCSRCGKVCRPEAHHRSYEPEGLLDVEWLCRECHQAEQIRWRRLAALAKFIEGDPEVVREGMRPIREVAAQTGVSDTTIRSLIQESRVRAERRDGKKWYVYPPDVQYLVDTGQVRPRSRQGQ